MSELFDTLRKLQQDVARNIVHILPPQTAFSDLSDHKEMINIADRAMIRVIRQANQINDWQFHYTTAIGYPFEKIEDRFMASRYSDGSFPVWYGSMNKITTIRETVHHMIKTEMNIENIQNHNMIQRERVIYNVFCDGILIDLTEKMTEYPKLISDDYAYTQKVGEKINQQGFPGLLIPSVRHKSGVNISVFKPDILNNPRIDCHLTYHFFPILKKVEVYEKKQKVDEILW